MNLLDFKKKILKFEVDKSIIYTPQTTSVEMLYESITMPPWTDFFSINDIQALYNTINSKRLSGNFDKKKAIIDQIMSSRGFKYMHGGTNRHVYVNYDIPWVVAKVPIDAVGMDDNIREFQNQKKIWPYCAKMIQLSPLGGVVGFAERVDPILNRSQFNAYKEMIYLVTIQILGKYVLEDIGTNYFKNWAVRNGFGPVLCDYPYIFELDGQKLICNAITPMGYCGGEIDYDDGFNKLYCKRCGVSYDAQSLSLAIDDKQIMLELKSKGGQKPMAAKLVKGDKVLSGSLSSDSIVKPSNVKKPGVVYTSEGKGARLIVKGKVVSGVAKPATTVGEKIMEKVSSTFSLFEVTDETKPAIEEAKKEPVEVDPVVNNDRIIVDSISPVDLAKIKKAVEETSEETPEPTKEEKTEVKNSESAKKNSNDRPRDPKTGHFMKTSKPSEASEDTEQSGSTANVEKSVQSEGVWSKGQKINKSSKTRRIIEESVDSNDTTVKAGTRT